MRLNNLESVSNENSLNVQYVADVVISETSKVEVYVPQKHVPEETENVHVSVPENPHK